MQSSLNKVPISKSHFYMLRCLIAMAHADDVFHEDEREYIEGMMNNLSLSVERIATLRKDMKTPEDIDALYSEIEEPRFRAQLIYFARIMAHKDGVLDPSEEELLERLNRYSLNAIDLEAVSDQIKGAVHADMLAHDISIEEGRPVRDGQRLSFFRWFDERMKDINPGSLKD